MTCGDPLVHHRGDPLPLLNRQGSLMARLQGPETGDRWRVWTVHAPTNCLAVDQFLWRLSR